jgi:protein TonB
MREFLKANFKYPERAEELGLQGKCYLKLTIWKTGEIKEVKVKKGVVDCPECDQEAIRLVRLMPKWLPGKVNGAAVNSYFMLPVSFKVN